MDLLQNIADTYFVFDPTWIICSCVLGFVMFRCLKGRRSFRKRCYAFGTVFYVVLVLFYTVLGRKTTGRISAEIIPFASYIRAAAGITDFTHIILNYVMFIPIGIMLPRLHSYERTIKGSFYLTLSIELLQLITTRGTFEIDDIIGNTLGAVIGCYICHKIRHFKYDYTRRYSTHHTHHRSATRRI